MADQPSSNPNSTPATQRRRSSIADLFNPRSSTVASMSSSPPSATTSTVAPPQQTARSISSIGLGGTSPIQSSPFTAFAKQRRASISTSSGSGSPEFRNSFGDEPAVIEEDDGPRGSATTPTSPSFGRRLSFGAQALRDVKQGGSVGGPGGGEGFNWSEALRDKTKRSPSFSLSANPMRSRTLSSAAAEPPKEMPKPPVVPAKMKKPDHLGERMLRGDFMMD